MMPKLHTPSSDAGSEINSQPASSSPLAEDSASVESEVSSIIPHDDGKPTLKNLDNDLSNKVAIKVAPQRGIEVFATREGGFYNQKRKEVNKPFYIRSKEEFGEWMKCTDADLEKERVEFYKQKKAKK